MILAATGESTRNLSHGKFDSPMAVYLYMGMLDGDMGDAEAADGEGNWANVYGRWVLDGDDRGFVIVYKYDTAEEAVRAVETWATTFEQGDEDDFEEEEAHVPGGLLDEIRQAERLAGTE